ncbi:hypothetical protein EYC84_005733 [Monilinia fructicola]|uniref:Uncharacterized protein n=1 Tax=Monilinia fructicola TaxID=38448 RepID=A0A5M9JXH0_MONFR|nr:hypothetical protein EYC84_005733 [Monilinia fructicola]
MNSIKVLIGYCICARTVILLYFFLHSDQYSLIVTVFGEGEDASLFSFAFISGVQRAKVAFLNEHDRISKME